MSARVAAQAAARVLAHPSLRLLGLHSHIGSQIFETSGFEVAARRVLGLHAQLQREHGVVLPELDLGGGFGVAYTTQHSPLAPRARVTGPTTPREGRRDAEARRIDTHRAA